MRKWLFILMGFFLVSAFQQREDAAVMNAHQKAIFLYNFTKLIEWPTDYKSGNFVIGVYGSYIPLVNELNKLASTKTAGTQKFEIKEVASIEAAAKYHILFVSTDKMLQFADVTSKLKGHGTLLVTEKEGMTKKGSAINFVVVENKIKFQLSKANAEKQQLKVSRDLEAFAVKEE